RERRHHQHARDEREGDRHAQIAQEEEEEAHQEDEDPVGRQGAASFASGSANPFFHPFTNCSMVKSATSTPHIGIAAYRLASGVIEGMRRLRKPSMKLR